MKSQIFDFSLVLALVASIPCAAQPQPPTKASAEEAVAMVKKGVSFFQKNGDEKGYAEINDKKGKFVDRDLYLVAYGLDGVVRAHGANPKMLNKNLMAFKDQDGKEFVKERVELAKSKGTFWQDYKFIHPTTKMPEAKRMYCEAYKDFIICGGIYK